MTDATTEISVRSMSRVSSAPEEEQATLPFTSMGTSWIETDLDNCPIGVALAWEWRNTDGG